MQPLCFCTRERHQRPVDDGQILIERVLIHVAERGAQSTHVAIRDLNNKLGLWRGGGGSRTASQGKRNCRNHARERESNRSALAAERERLGKEITRLSGLYERNLGQSKVEAGITTDIARTLAAPLEHAERLKALHGSAFATSSDEREIITFPSVQQALLPTAVFVAITTVEGHFLTPSLIGRHLTMRPFVIFLSLAFWTWLWGPVGLLIATPLTLCLVVLGRHVERLEFLDVLLGDVHSLKEKRSVVRPLVAEVRRRFAVSAAEVVSAS